MIDDLKHFHAHSHKQDAFQIIEESAAFIVLMVLAVLALIFAPYL